MTIRLDSPSATANQARGAVLIQGGIAHNETLAGPFSNRGRVGALLPASRGHDAATQQQTITLDESDPTVMTGNVVNPTFGARAP